MRKQLLAILLMIYSANAYSVQPLKKTLIICGVDQVPFQSESLENKGFYAEIVVTAMEMMGYKPKVVLLPWKRAYENSKRGKCDGLIGASFKKERKEFFIYPEYHWASRVSLFTKTGKGKIRYVKTGDLCPGSVGMLRGSYFSDTMREKYPCLKQDLANTPNQLIKKAFGNRTTYIVDYVVTVNYWNAKYKNRSKLTEVKPPVYTDKIYTVFSKKHHNYKQLGKDFDTGINKIKSDGTYADILKRHGIR